ncbi:DctP (periplasmic C4-dicarboxylate binding protein) [Roseobacter sp. SK209-2-6]|uniref:TRAP transporter substrate-binding protein DctP n=1 Tax=Roseobacter sp. SK209-2-6 TaxID=388739 RepID=UPI0000F3EEAA|nr:TRAP transporter substrate-binding protein DctP [Roseobacter sp. SK209-2-6]EBA16808.1 DctP (periplasmic C4-dicarboxylate binding protein) [Roseobacter sp. SK209-2-6]
MLKTLKIGKTLARTGLAGVLAMSVATLASAADMRLKFAGTFPVDHPGTKMMEQIKADIEAADVGLKMSLFPANQLGSGEALMEDTMRGNIDFTAAFIYSHKDPRLEFLSMPFLVNDFDEMDAVMRNMDSPFNQILQERLSELGLRLLANNPEGFTGIVANKKPDNWADLGPKNMNIRVWSSPVVKNMVEGLGFQATTMAWGDIFPALQSGIVDGAICCTKSATYSIFAQSDVGKYYVQYNSVSELTSYYASEKTWAKMNEQQREVVQAAFSKASDDFFAYNRENDAKFAEMLEGKGYEILALNGDEQAAMGAWVRENIWPTMVDSVGQETIDRLTGN